MYAVASGGILDAMAACLLIVDGTDVPYAVDDREYRHHKKA